MSRRSTKNLPWSEWLAAWFGPTKRGVGDVLFAGPNGPDRTLLYGVFCMKNFDEHGHLTQPSLLEEIEARGYDTTTLEFRIKRKAVV